MKQLVLFTIFFSILEIGITKAQYTTLVNFTDTIGVNPGATPYGSLTLSGGLFYGMTQAGGANNKGVIFSYDPVGNIYTDLINFTGNTGANPGEKPWGSLTFSGGLLYGVTTKGGTYGKGVIFSYNPVGNIYTDLVDLIDTLGAYPVGSLTESGGLFYGMTISGGNHGFGVIFSYDPVGNLYNKLVNFTGASGSNPGANPYGSLILSGGIFYGLTAGGGTDFKGVLFSYDPVGIVYTALVNFTDTSGARPSGSLTVSGGIFYGLTGSGGANNKGVIFSYNPAGSVYTVEANFTGIGGSCPGANPLSSLTLSGGILYGTTWTGGLHDIGVIFSYNPAGNIYTPLVEFSGNGGTHPGSNSQSSLTVLGDRLYGMTSLGGPSGFGVIFSFKDNKTGIDNINAGAGIKLFPDPNHGSFTLRISSVTNELVTISITNATGKKVKEFTITTNTDAHITINQPPGNYFISALTGSQKLVEKIVVE